MPLRVWAALAPAGEGHTGKWLRELPGLGTPW